MQHVFDEERILVKLTKLRILFIVLLVFLLLIFCLSVADKLVCITGGAEGTACQKIGFFTREERFYDEAGKRETQHELNDIKKGDILISMSTHTLGWRHGHCAIVTSVNPDRTVEAALLGKPSGSVDMKHWKSYGTVFHLRVKEEVAQEALIAANIPQDSYTNAQDKLGELAAEFADEYCIDKQYSLFAGFREKAPVTDDLASTQCAHLIWYVYKQFDIDLDSDGGVIVTPEDLLHSEFLTMVE